MKAKISNIEYALPKNQVSNLDLKEQFPNYDFESFEKKVGIKNRFVVSEDQTALDLAVEACEKLFLKEDKEQVDFILYCTQSPEYFLPTTACVLQDKLGLRKNIGALDFNLGCSGFTYGLSLAGALIATNQAKNILLVTAETYSKFIHPKDRTNRSIFGDAASAILIKKSELDDFSQFQFGTDGSGFDKLIVKNGCSRFPFDPDAEEISYGSDNIYTENHLYMNGPDVFNFTTKEIPGFVNGLLADNNLTVDDIDQFIFHQANAFMLDFLRKRLKIPKEKFFIDFENEGNTVSSTIPIALKKYSDQVEFKESKKVMLVGFGVGLSWSGGIVTINNKL